MNKRMPPNFFSGLSGVVLPIPKYQFPLEYQKTSRLTYYATFFNSIEVNNSFYRIPQKTTLSRWTSSMHESFKFTFKLFKEITHVKDLDYNEAYIQQFMESIEHIGDKKGCILVQFPPSLENRHIHELENILRSLRNADPHSGWNVAVEFRNRSWYNEDIYDVLNAYNATLVKHDIQASATPLTNLLSNIIYVRFHGPTGNYRGSYSEAFLSEYAAYVQEWLTEGKIVYVYFNNTAGDAFNNLTTLNKFVLDE
jgi:uncharacterized protein YecE (DUF72 family)